MKQFRQKRSPSSIFPAPENGEVVELNPPSLQWVAEPGVSLYRVRVERLPQQETVAAGTTAYNYFRIRRLLAPGRYRWNVASGDAELGWREFEVPASARPFLVPSAREVLARVPDIHPRHIHYRADLPELRERHKPQLEIIRRNVKLALSQGFMRYPDFYRPDGRIDYRRAFDESRQYFDRNLVACALAFLLLDDREAGQYAHEAVLRLCEWNPAGPASVYGQWGDEIGLSICRVLPAVLDWTWHLYTPQELKWAANTLARHAEQLWERVTGEEFLAHPGNSHVGRLPGYLGEAALVLYGTIPDETAERWLNYALEVYGSIFPHYGGRDGGWAEGPFYASSYTKWYLPFFFAVERHCGFSFLEKPFYRRVSQFFLHFAPPGQEAHPFGDGNWPTADEWPGFQAQDPFGVYAERFGPPEAREFSRQLTGAIDRYELHLLDVIRPRPPHPEPDAAGPASDSYCSRDTGLLSMRRCVADPVHDVAVLARCSCYGTPSHQHADQGNFAVLAAGKALIAPSGSFGYIFGEPHHRDWTQQTVGHNCILADGKGQPKDSAEAVGVILDFQDDGRLCRAEFDLSAAYRMLTNYTRTLEFDREALLLRVTDELEAPGETVIDFRLHSYARPAAEKELVRLSRFPASAEIRLRSTAGTGTFSWTDRFRHPGGGPEYPLGRQLCNQYHLNWRFPACRRLRIDAEFRISPG